MHISGLFDLTGKIALITGSSRGLGLAMARGLAEAGAAVILNGRDEQRLRAAQAALRKDGHKVSVHAFDVTDDTAAADGIAAIERETGPLDILVNNAGIQKRGPLETIPGAVWDEVIRTNLTSAWLAARHAVRGMLARRRGKIINVCSLMSEMARKSVGPYAAAKGGLKMLTKSMAVEWGAHNIQVNGIGPGYFITEMTQPLVDDPAFDAWVKMRTPAARWGRVEELSGTIIYLASAASDFVNGQIIYVDGGILASL